MVGEKMIDREQIINNVEKLINGEIDDYCPFLDSNTNVVEGALENIVIRLVNSFKKYCAGTAGVSDYISALRSFMLSFQTELRVEDHGVFEHNHFGIHFNPASQKYYATYETPAYIRVYWKSVKCALRVTESCNFGRKTEHIVEIRS